MATRCTKGWRSPQDEKVALGSEPVMLMASLSKLAWEVERRPGRPRVGAR